MSCTHANVIVNVGVMREVWPFIWANQTPFRTVNRLASKEKRPTGPAAPCNSVIDSMKKEDDIDDVKKSIAALKKENQALSQKVAALEKCNEPKHSSTATKETEIGIRCKAHPPYQTNGTAHTLPHRVFTVQASRQRTTIAQDETKLTPAGDEIRTHD